MTSAKNPRTTKTTTAADQSSSKGTVEADLTTDNAAGRVASARDIANKAWEYRCSLDMLAQLARVNVEDLTVRRDMSEPPASARRAAEEALTLLAELQARDLEPVTWLNELIVENVPVRRKALTSEAALALADGALTAPDAMDMIRSDWRAAWNVKTATKNTRTKTRPVQATAAGTTSTRGNRAR